MFNAEQLTQWGPQSHRRDSTTREERCASSGTEYRAVMALDAFRSDDGNEVDALDAQEAWNRAARPVLVQVARRYGSLIAPADLAEEVQALSNVRTRESAVWIEDVLDAVGVECGARGEPLLSAFVIGPDGRIGERYEQLVVKLEGSAPTDIEMHAATQRLEAHRYHGATLPVDGGKPTLPPQLPKRRASATKSTTTRTRTTRAKAPATPRKHKNPEVVRAVCPTCFLTMPANGICDTCNE
jgi:hypothetical protein